MKIFIGWSGEHSGRLAAHLKSWLKGLFDDIDVFVSVDIPAGRRWREVLDEQLKDVEFGILCFTPYNLDSHWLHFEAGALSSLLKNGVHVCPLLLGVKQSDLSDPLRHFQCVSVNRRGLHRLIMDIHRATGTPRPVNEIEDRLNERWQDISRAITQLMKALDNTKNDPHNELVLVQRSLTRQEFSSGLFRECVDYGIRHFINWAQTINENSPLEFDEPVRLREVGIVILNKLKAHGFMTLYYSDVNAWRADKNPSTDDDYLECCRHTAKRGISLTRVYVIESEFEATQELFKELVKTDKEAGIETRVVGADSMPNGAPVDFAIWDDELLCWSEVAGAYNKKKVLRCRYYRDKRHITDAMAWRKTILVKSTLL